MLNIVHHMHEFICSLQPQEFMSKNEQERSELKVSLLLERFKIYFRSNAQSQESRHSVCVLSMSLADPDEAMSHIGTM